MSQTFVIVLRPAEAPDKWTAEAVRECYITASEEHSRRDIGIAEIVPSAHSGGWADAMLEANAQIHNLGEPEADPPPMPAPDEEDDEEEDRLNRSIKEMTAIGVLAVAEWTGETPRYVNTAYAVRGFRFHWSAVRVLGLVGTMTPVVEKGDCDHDPSEWGSAPGIVNCAKGCGATWQATLAPTPDPHG